ncbi:MAG: hypothetical protein K5871_11575 [Lachnospiraceae bacterium]|nr:hypothetical protein [Lachnospiraceae bacterium]
MEDKKNWKKCLILMISFTTLLMLLAAGLVLLIDPFFHFHAPLPGFSYIMDDERYQNDGIIRNFDYDILITGTSVSENFRVSLCDELFGGTSVKATCAGGYYREIADTERRALEYNPDLKVVIRSMDTSFVLFDKDYRNPEAPDPVYLYDDDPYNDEEYLFNGDVLFEYVCPIILRTIRGIPSDTMEDYMRFAEDRPLGAAYALQDIVTIEPAVLQRHLTEEERLMLTENIRCNLAANVEAYPDVEFYYFFPPYSIAEWIGAHIALGTMPAYIETMEIMTGEMLKYDNVHVFCFYDDTDMITDLNNYSDMYHYSGEISDRILEQMAAGEHELTGDTYREYFESVEEFYTNYDYALMFATE